MRSAAGSRGAVGRRHGRGIRAVSRAWETQSPGRARIPPAKKKRQWWLGGFEPWSGLRSASFDSERLAIPRIEEVGKSVEVLEEESGPHGDTDEGIICQADREMDRL